MMKSETAIQEANVTEELVLDISQWLIVIGIFFANRIEMLCILLATIAIGIRKKTVYTSTVLKYMLTVYTVSFITITLVGYDYTKLLQQAALLSFFLLCYEQFFYHNMEKIVPLFIKYIKMCFYISVLGLIQELIFGVAGINIAEYLPFYHQTLIAGSFLRITSTLSEGGYLGTVLIPCLVYLFYYNDPYKILGKKKYLIFIVSLFTFSPFVYIFFVVLFFIKLRNKLQYFKILSTVTLFCVVFYGTIQVYSSDYENETGGLEGLLMRYRDTISMIDIIRESGVEMEDLAMLNTSTAVMYTNTYVSFMAPSRLIGTGLGTHAQNHSNIVGSTFDDGYSFTELNVEDGYSLMARILSELGVCGIILYILYLVKYFNKDNFLNICLFFILCCFFIRGGSYVDFGTVFFHFAYFYTAGFDLKPKDVIFL